MASIQKRIETLERQLSETEQAKARARGADTVPAYLVHRLDAIFSDFPTVDTVELAALLIEITGNAGCPPDET